MAAWFLHTQRMGMSTLRQTAPERPAPAVYWRRRFVALILGLSVLAVVTWAFAGALAGPAPPSRPTAARTAAVSPRVTSLPAISPVPGGSAAAQLARAASRLGLATSRNAPRSCPSGDIVLSLFSDQASYSVRQIPQFNVDVVSTDGQTCVFDIGAKHVLLQISDGSTVVWTSGDCAEGQASLVTRLHRGVPTVVPIAWDGEHSSAGCPVPGSSAAAGTYTAVARDGSNSSNPFSFGFG